MSTDDALLAMDKYGYCLSITNLLKIPANHDSAMADFSCSPLVERDLLMVSAT
jgi:hypothetical protein